MSTQPLSGSLHPAPGFSRVFLVLAWMGLAVGIVFVASPSVDHETQKSMVAIVLVLLLMLTFVRKTDVGRILFLALAGFLVLRYFVWRTFTTLSYHDTLSFSFAILLYAAEMYGVAIFFLGGFVNIRPFKRQPAPLPEDQSTWPTVDVFVPSYNESRDILETTLIAALQMNYPRDRFRVYLLDDGGTDQKCEQADPAKRAEAIERRREMQELCHSVGANYLTRARNEHAKAGNINSAFKDTVGELILILDADHVPTQDFLQSTVGRFLIDPGLFMVQTPHFAVNADPVERNLKTFHFMPSEQEMFYNGIQHGLDHWNASSFCGSAAVLRRSCLEELGGICGRTITEDAETALELHARGYSSEYIGRPMIAGLAPPTIQAFITQRSRWAQGMLQVFMLSNPIFKPGLSMAQRLCYLNSCLFWLFPLVRLVYTLAPCAFLIFGLKIYTANWQSFLSFALPYVVSVLLTSNYVHGRVRWPFISDVYEMLQAIHLVPPVLQALFRPTSGVFKVTPKKETLDKDFVSASAWPVQLLFIINLGAIVGGVWRLSNMPEDLYPAAITLFWASLNAVVLAGALGAVTERRQESDGAVVSMGLDARLEGFGEPMRCEVKEMEIGCCRVATPYQSGLKAKAGETGKLRVVTPDGGKQEFTVKYRRALSPPGKEAGTWLEMEFAPASVAETKAKVALMFGDSQRWVDFQSSRQRTLNMLHGGAIFSLLAARGFFHHLRVMLGGSSSRRTEPTDGVGTLNIPVDAGVARKGQVEQQAA